MQRRQPDATLGALQVAGHLTGDAVDVIVISTDEALIATLQESASGAHALWHAPSIEAAVELLVGGRCGILIADMQVLRSDAAAALERLQSQFPELVLLATGRREEEGRVAGLISKGSVYRFLHKPVSPSRANLFLATATRRYRELAQNTSPALASVRQLTQPANRVPLIAGGIVALLLIAAAGAWLLRPEHAPEVADAPPAASVAATPPASPAVAVSDLLAAARTAFSAGRLVIPPGDNALDRYRSVLAVEPDNAQALAGVQDVLDALETQVTQALQARDAAGAARAFTTLQKAQPDHPQLQVLNDQLLTLSRSIRPAPPTPAPASPAASPASVPSAPNTQLARSRIAAGQLVEPESDSAVFYLRAARDSGEDESANRILATDVGTRLLMQARQALEDSDDATARQQFATARALDLEFDLALPDLADVERDLDVRAAAAAQALIGTQLAPIIKLREGGHLIEPAGNNAFERLQSLAGQSPDAPEVRAEQQRLAFTLLDHGRTALVQGDLDRADLLTSRAEVLVPRMANTRTLREQITAAKAEREAASRIVQAGELPRTREVPADYPTDAERRGVEGWVDVEFTIATDGRTQNLVVRESQPVGVFDKAALDALGKWRFVPVTRNGKVVEQRAILRVRFALK